MADAVTVAAETVHIVAAEGPVRLEVDNRARKVATLSGLPQAAGTPGAVLADAAWALADGVSTPYEAVRYKLRIPNVPQFLGHNGYVAVVRAQDDPEDVQAVVGITLGGGSTGSVATVDAAETYHVAKNGIGNALGLKYRPSPDADTDEITCVHVADQAVHDPAEPVVVDLWEWQSMPSEADAIAAINAHLATLDREFQDIHAQEGGPLPAAATSADADAPNGIAARLWSGSVLARLVRAVVTARFIRPLLAMSSKPTAPAYVRGVTHPSASSLNIETVAVDGTVSNTLVAITGAAQGAGITTAQAMDAAGLMLSALPEFTYSRDGSTGTLTFTPPAPAIADGSITLAELAQAVQDLINGAASLSQIRVEARADRPELTADQQAAARTRLGIDDDRLMIDSTGFTASDDGSFPAWLTSAREWVNAAFSDGDGFSWTFDAAARAWKLAWAYLPFTSSDAAKLDALSKPTGAALGTGFVTPAAVSGGFEAERRAGQTPRGQFTGARNLVLLEVSESGMTVGVTGDRAANDSAVFELGGKRVHLDQADPRLVDAESVAGVVNYSFVGDYVDWLSANATSWTLYDEAQFVPAAPNADGKILYSRRGLVPEWRDVPPEHRPRVYGVLAPGVSTNSANTNARGAAPVDFSPAAFPANLGDGVLDLTVEITLTSSSANTAFERHANAATAAQKRRFASVRVYAAQIASMPVWTDGTMPGGIDLMNWPVYASPDTLSGRYRLYLVKRAVQGLGLFGVWEGRSGGQSIAVEANVHGSWQATIAAA